jgi:hypothetical protein
MKTKIVFIIFLNLTIIYLSQLKAQNQNNLKWIRRFYSSEYSASPGFVEKNDNLFMPINYSGILYYIVNDDPLPLTKANCSNTLLCKFNNVTGELNTHCNLKSNAPLAITSINLSEDGLLMAGSYRDSVFGETDSSALLYLGGTPGLEKAFTIKLDFNFNLINFQNQNFSTEQSGFNSVTTFDDKFVAIGTASLDSSDPMFNYAAWDQAEDKITFMVDTVQGIILSSTTNFKDKPWVCGSFADSLVLADTIFKSSSGTQAFGAILQDEGNPYTNALVWRSRQLAHAVSLASKDNFLWAAVNYSDTLFLPNGQYVVSLGMTDGAILQYDTVFNLTHIYQLGGIYSDRIDKLFVDGDILFVLGNIASPDGQFYKDGISILQLDTIQHIGLQILISIKDGQPERLEWAAHEGRLGKIAAAKKLNSSEFFIAGTYAQPLIIDSIEFKPYNISNIYLMRIANDCINQLKKSNLEVNICQGDSLKIEGAYFIGSKQIGLNSDSSFIILKMPGKYAIKLYSNCQCNVSDTLEVKFLPNIINQKSFIISTDLQIYTLSNGNLLKIIYCGECKMAPSEPVFYIFPNPFDKEATIQAELPNAARLNLILLNSQGQKVMTQEKYYNSGKHVIHLNTKSLQAGSYWLQISCRNESAIYTKIFTLIKI